jgi:hypothetical protein
MAKNANKTLSRVEFSAHLSSKTLVDSDLEASVQELQAFSVMIE